jgi:hypothetical protein
MFSGMTADSPSAGAALRAAILARQAARRSGVARGVRVTQARVLVGVRMRAADASAAPAARAFEELFNAGERGAVGMALEACRLAGRSISSPDKASRAVRAELRAIGRESLWRRAKVKSGRPSPKP